MHMESDVRSTTLTASGSIFGGPARVKGIYVVFGGSTGSILIKDGGSGGTTLVNLAMPANTVSSGTYILLPGNGVRCETNAYATLSNVTSVTFFYA